MNHEQVLSAIGRSRDEVKSMALDHAWAICVSDVAYAQKEVDRMAEVVKLSREYGTWSCDATPDTEEQIMQELEYDLNFSIDLLHEAEWARDNPSYLPAGTRRTVAQRLDMNMTPIFHEMFNYCVGDI